VALGRAICSDPALLLLDEPLAALDLALRRRLLPYLRRLRDELAIPMLLVSHDPGEIQALAENVLVLDRGRQVAFGPARSVLASAEVVGRSRELGWNNVLPGVVLPATSGRSGRRDRGDRGGAGQVALGGLEALALTTPPLRSPEGASILVGLPSHEILLATVQPVGLSARNVLPATVVEVQHGPDLEAVVVRLDPSLPDLVVDVTESARDDLALAPGREIWVIVKAAGVEIYEEAQPPAAAGDPGPPQRLASRRSPGQR
jgi:molybdate transport system ATP-binding protein